LPDVREGVGDWSLKQTLGGRVKRLRRGKIVVELFQRSEVAGDFRVPCEWFGIVPCRLAFSHGKSPIEKIADVSEDFRWGSRAVAESKQRERFWGAAQRFSTAIGDRGHGVAKELASGICSHGHGDPFSEAGGQKLTLSINADVVDKHGLRKFGGRVWAARPIASYGEIENHEKRVIENPFSAGGPVERAEGRVEIGVDVETDCVGFPLDGVEMEIGGKVLAGRKSKN